MKPVCRVLIAATNSGCTFHLDNNNNSVNDSDSEQDTTSSEDVEEGQEENQMENEFQQTNPLLEQIKNSVNGALSS